MAPKFGQVKKNGKIGKVLVHDPQDSAMTWKLEIDGKQAWFGAAAVQEVQHDEVDVVNQEALKIISQDWAYVRGLSRKEKAESYAEQVLRMRAGVSKGASMGTGGYGGDATSNANVFVTTFEEMAVKQAGILKANLAYVNLVLEMFPEIVKDFCRCGVSAEYTDLLALRIRREIKVKKGEVLDTGEFKACMLPALRALFPGSWNARKEEVWSWMWDTTNAQLQETLPKLRKLEKCGKWIDGLEQAQIDQIGKKAWAKFFAHDPAAEAKFTMARGRLVFIANIAMRFSARLYKEPMILHTELEAVGLKHTQFGVNPKNFEGFVKCMHDEIADVTTTETCDGVHWAMCLVAMILARSVIEVGLCDLEAVEVRDDESITSGGTHSSFAHMRGSIKLEQLRASMVAA